MYYKEELFTTEPEAAKKTIFTLFDKVKSLCGANLDTLLLNLEGQSPVEKLIKASGLCFYEATVYFIEHYSAGDPLYETFNYYAMLNGLRPDREAKNMRQDIRVETAYRMSDAVKKVGIDQLAEDRIFNVVIGKSDVYDINYSPRFVGNYAVSKGVDKGDAGGNIRFIEGDGFVFVPATFYEKCMSKPLEALCDVVRVMYVATSYSLGRGLDKDRSVEEEVDRLVAYFLNRVIEEDKSVITYGLLTDSLKHILKKDEQNRNNRKSKGFGAGRSPVRGNPALN